FGDVTLFFSSRRRHTRSKRDWSSDVCSSDLIEFELKRNMTKKWDVCFDDLNILQPAWKTLEKSSERAMVYMLLNEEDEWGYLDRKTKAKFKKIIKEISDVHLENDMKNILQNEHMRLKNELADWMRPSQYDKMRFFKH